MASQLRIALIQAPLAWQSPSKNRTYFTRKIQSVNKDADLVILPEMFTTGFTMTPEQVNEDEGDKTLQWMLQMSKKQHKAIIGSIPFYENSKYTNRLFFVNPDQNVFYYDKRHTFTLAGENKVYEAGQKKLIVDYKGFRICPMICYDLRFPVWARNMENYDVLVYVANWPKPRIAAWDTLLKARAIENMVYCIGVNRIGTDETGHEYPGHSAVYDCLGKQISFSKKEEVLFAVLDKEHITTTRNNLRFLEDRDHFILKA